MIALRILARTEECVGIYWETTAVPAARGTREKTAVLTSMNVPQIPAKTGELVATLWEITAAVAPLVTAERTVQ